MIEVDSLEKIFIDEGEQTPALRGVSFSIQEGEFVAIMGPSGSGKSTLMHILSFLDRPTGGHYLFLKQNIVDLSDEELAKIRNKSMGFVFQMFNLLPYASVYENVELPLVYSDIPKESRNEKVMKAIESVGLSHRASQQAGKLSGGEKQRVAIARALINDPAVIFADEPTGNLDSKSGAQVMEILSDLNEAGRTIILVTHETYTSQYARRIIRIRDGKIESDTLLNKEEHRRSAKDFIK